MTLEQKVIAAFFAGLIIILGGGYTGKILMDDVPRASKREFMRMIADQDEVSRVKCLDPNAEFNIAESKYLQKYNLLFSPESKYDILSEDSNEKNEKQIADANALKLTEDLVLQGCADASAENIEIKQATKWDYFKSHWKEMMFNVK